MITGKQEKLITNTINKTIVLEQQCSVACLA